jgi:GT2 family glycosyltransferase
MTPPEMTETSSPPSFSGHLVTAVLVSHDGAQWLPEVLDAVRAQTRPPDRLVAVDTGSTDASRSLIVDALAPDAVIVPEPVTTSFAAALKIGLSTVHAEPDREPGLAAGVAADPDPAVDPEPETGPAVEWLWLLHDDCAPDPAALEQLLLRVIDSPSVWLVGPKVRAWDGARLLEAGLTIDATGHVDTGFDGIELDQGQRDDVDEVLAVGTAGALVRRDVWDRLDGLNPAWPTYAGDVDFGWRVNAAGGRVVVATDAVIRHVRAQTVGRRPTVAFKGSSAVLRRRSGMQVVLSNTSAWLVAPLLLRYLIGGPLRAAGLLVLARRPAQAFSELRAVVGVIAQPMLIVGGRRRRDRIRLVPHRELRRLLPTAASRWRSSPLRVSRFRAERAVEAGRSATAETGPVSEESESLALDASVVSRFFRLPGTVMFLAMTLLALIAERHVLSSALHGGRLLPAPGGASDLWSTYIATWHPSELGSVTASPPSLAVLALLSSIALGKVWLVVDVLLLGAVPLSALSAYTAARALTTTVQVRIWAAVAYALLPAVTGAIAGGRLDVALVAILLPQVIRAGAGALRSDALGRSWRPAIGAGLLLAVVAAFSPVLWLIAVVALLLAIGFGLLEGGQTGWSGLAQQGAAGLIVVIVPILVLMPWSGHALTQPVLWLRGSGLPEFYTSHGPPNGLSLAFLRAGGPAQPPVWIGIPILAAALLGLTRQSRVVAARVGAALLVAGVAIAVGITRTAGVTAGVPSSRHWPGVVLLVAGAGALLAALVAAVGARPALREQSFGWRQPAAVGLVALALISTAVLAGSWLVRGAGRPLTSNPSAALPLFTQGELAVPAAPRALLLRSSGSTISYALVRRPSGPQIGDADTAPTPGSAGDRQLAAAVRDLVAGRAGATSELVPFGIRYVVASSASVPRLRSALGTATTLTVHPTVGATVWSSSLPTGELTVLEPAAGAAALAGRVPTQQVAQVLDATAGAADVALTVGPTPGLLVLNEPRNSGWHATLDGRRLAPRTAYGWAQAFALTPGHGQLRVGFRSSTRPGWLIGELAALVAALIAIFPVRRVDDAEGPA